MAKDAKGHGSEGRGQSAREERIAMRMATDERHYPTRSAQDIQAARVLGGGHPKSSPPVPYGQARAVAQRDLQRGRTVALPRGQEFRRASL